MSRFAKRKELFFAAPIVLFDGVGLAFLLLSLIRFDISWAPARVPA